MLRARNTRCYVRAVDMDTTWPEYLRALSNNQSAIARAAEVSTGTVSRWISGQMLPKAEQVINVARRFDESPLAALVAAGYLDPSEIPSGMTMPRMLQLKRFTDVELAKELYVRTLVQRDGPLDERVYVSRRALKTEAESDAGEILDTEGGAALSGVPSGSGVASSDSSVDIDEDFEAEPDAGATGPSEKG